VPFYTRRGISSAEACNPLNHSSLAKAIHTPINPKPQPHPGNMTATLLFPHGYNTIITGNLASPAALREFIIYNIENSSRLQNNCNQQEFAPISIIARSSVKIPRSCSEKNETIPARMIATTTAYLRLLIHVLYAFHYRPPHKMAYNNLSSLTNRY